MLSSNWKDKHFWRQDRVYHALCCSILNVNKIYWQIVFGLIPLQPYGWISETFWRRSLLPTSILTKTMRLTFKRTCCTFVFLKILLDERLIRSYLTQVRNGHTQVNLLIILLIREKIILKIKNLIMSYFRFGFKSNYWINF